jgi:hypothetical protein
MKSLFFPTVAVLLAATVVSGCNEEIIVECIPEDIEITTSTTGVDLDADGYTLSVDDSLSHEIGVNDTRRLLLRDPVGDHSLELADVADNCTVQGDNPRSVNVPECLGPLEVMFEVACASLTPTAYSIGVYYYPWHYDDFHGRQYLREHLVPSQRPELGEYNDRDADVISQHLEWSRWAGIDLWVASWWGPGSRENVTLLNHILPHPNLGNIKIAIFYETAGRTNDFTDYSALVADMTYLAGNYFGRPNYLRIDGKPVLFVYLTRVLSARGTLGSSLNTIRDAASAAGYDIYIVGDHAFGSAPAAPGDIAMLDAITNYDVYGSVGATGYAHQASVDAYFADQAEWKALAHGVDVAFLPGVTPGFNDRGVRDGHIPLSRRLAAEQDFGSLFRAMVRKAKQHVDERVGRIIMVTSWNEWHEDTQIEPVQSAPPVNSDDSQSGTDYTTGLYYEGYGLRYLAILREESDSS